MNIICDKTQLLEILSNVSKAVAARSSLAALEGILLRAEGDRLSLTGYDLDMGITSSMECTVREEGAIVLTARLFVDMIRRMTGETVSIASDEKLMTTIRSGVSEFTILGLSAEEYPELPALTDADDVSIEQDKLRSMIEQTLFAIANNDSKPVHTGSLFEVSGEDITVVSVDGFRLALRREKILGDKELRFVVPGKTLSELAKMLGDGEEMVTLYVNRKHISFETGGYTIVSRLLEGEFLDYKSAIPPASQTVVTVNTREMIAAIERTSLLISDRLKSPLRIHFGDGLIRMSCSTAIGRAYDEVPCKLEHDEVEMGFNNRYLLDALRASECDEVALIINGPLSPMKMVPLQGDSFLFLVLPVRLKAE